MLIKLVKDFAHTVIKILAKDARASQFYQHLMGQVRIGNKRPTGFVKVVGGKFAHVKFEYV